MDTRNPSIAAVAAPAAPVAAAPRRFGFWSRSLMVPALRDSFVKLAPATQWRNPVMFVVYVGSILTTVLWLMALAGRAEAPSGFILAVSAWLWFTVLFANFAEALAEGRGKQQAATLRGLRTTIQARVIKSAPSDQSLRDATPEQWQGSAVLTPSGDLRKGDVTDREATGFHRGRAAKTAHGPLTVPGALRAGPPALGAPRTRRGTTGTGDGEGAAAGGRAPAGGSTSAGVGRRGRHGTSDGSGRRIRRLGGTGTGGRGGRR